MEHVVPNFLVAQIALTDTHLRVSKHLDEVPVVFAIFAAVVRASQVPHAKRIASLLLALVALSGCATLDDQQCRTANWENVGLIDGQRGRDESFKNQHAHACEGVAQVDEEAFHRGWARGHADYCQPENGYFVGLRGEQVPLSCPLETASAFNEQYEKGRHVHLLKEEREELNKRIEKENKDRAEDQSVLNHASQVIHLLSGTSPTQDLEDRATRLSEEITKLQVSAPFSTAASHEAGTSLNLVNTMGAFVSTGFGFGLGHAIQGRYSTTGWKWTLAEGAAFAAFIGTTQASCTSSERGCTSGWPAVALLGFLGIHVWQSVDAWSYAWHSSQGYDMSEARPSSPWSIAILPMGVAGSYSFQ